MKSLGTNSKERCSLPLSYTTTSIPFENNTISYDYALNNKLQFNYYINNKDDNINTSTTLDILKLILKNEQSNKSFKLMYINHNRELFDQENFLLTKENQGITMTILNGKNILKVLSLKVHSEH